MPKVIFSIPAWGNIQRHYEQTIGQSVQQRLNERDTSGVTSYCDKDTSEVNREED